MPYTHFTQSERIELQDLLSRRLKCKEIAYRLGNDYCGPIATAFHA